MVFKRLLGSLGVGGPTVDTVLSPAPALPGGMLSGEIRLRGGSSDADIEHITLELVAGVEAEHEEGESESGVVFERFTVGGGFRLSEDEERTVPFTVTLPWETPVTELYGQDLGIVLGLRTELSVAGARDKGDLDRLTVTPRPVQEAVLEAFGQLGFGFRSADLELGRIGGTGQQLPFYQVLELTPSPAYAHAVNEIEVTFLAAPTSMEVVLEADKRGGLGQPVAVARHRAGHQDVG
ncbi:sporulation protein, partial [Streptomyces anthocyanicus]|uniref:sporulation protein n=1 Tax=Streptomyces anthocyanicus TaxID=68174 RepID=UPI003699E556